MNENQQKTKENLDLKEVLIMTLMTTEWMTEMMPLDHLLEKEKFQLWVGTKWWMAMGALFKIVSKQPPGMDYDQKKVWGVEVCLKDNETSRMADLREKPTTPAG